MVLKLILALSTSPLLIQTIRDEPPHPPKECLWQKGDGGGDGLLNSTALLYRINVCNVTLPKECLRHNH
jgi:hypothetical protein